MNEMVCIVCPNGCRLKVIDKEGELQVVGAKCKRGIAFAKEECTAPKRSVTTTIPTVFPERPVLPVRTNGEIPKEMIGALMNELAQLTIDHIVSRGEVILANVLGTGIDVISTSDMHYAMKRREDT